MIIRMPVQPCRHCGKAKVKRNSGKWECVHLHRKDHSYHGATCKKCGSTLRIAGSCFYHYRADHLSDQAKATRRKKEERQRANPEYQKWRKQYEQSASFKQIKANYQNSIPGYIKNRMRQIDQLRNQYQQELEEVQQELREIESGLT